MKIISDENRQFLSEFIINKYDISDGETVLKNIEEIISSLDSDMTGRLAMDTVDLMILYFYNFIAAKELGHIENGIHVEIGTLFGGSALTALKAIEAAGGKGVYYMIDPFDGYYGKGTDIITGINITEENVISNMEKFAIQPDKYRILKNFSGDKEAVNAVRDKKILTLFIDGNHSYEGIKSDWRNYSPHVAVGGYVIFDNYNDVYWQEVSRFINEELLPAIADDWQPELVYNKTFVLKRLPEKESALDMIKAELAELKSEYGEFQDELRLLKKELKKIDAEKQELNLELEKFKLKLREQREENEKLRKANAEYEEKLDDIEVKIDVLERELDNLDILKRAIGDICNKHHFKQPVEKLKAYRRLIDLYWEMR